MKVNVQYAQDHLAELLETADHGEQIEIAREGKPTYGLSLVPKQESRTGKRILGAGAGDSEAPVFGAGRGEIVLPTAEEWKAMDREIEDLMLNGPLFPSNNG